MAEKKTYYIRISGKRIEVTREVYLAYYRMERRARFLNEKDEKNGLVYYNELDSEGMLGEDMIPDSTAPSVEAAVENIMKQELRKSLEKLPAEDRKLIQAVYFEGKSGRQIANEMGIPQTTVSYRCRRAIAQLKKILQK